MKKTLLVTLDFYPSLGGIAGYWECLSREMLSHEWVVLAPLLPHGVQELQVPYTIYRRAVLSRWVNPHWLPLLFHIMSVVRKEKIKRIIVGQILPIGTAVRILFSFFRIPYVVSCHGMDILLPQQSRRKRRLCAWIFKSAEKIIANSQFTARELSHFGVPKETAVVVYPCPVIIPELPSDTLKKDHLNPTILTVARLYERKGHEIILRALPSLLKKHSTLEYAIIGDGPYREKLDILTKQLGIEGSVAFLGTPSSQETARWFARCSVFAMTPKVLPGDMESFGIVYLEANSFGKAVVGTRCGGIPEAVVDGVSGLLVDPESIEQTAAAIDRLLSDPVYAEQLGRQGKERVSREFHWSAQAQQLRDILH